MISERRPQQETLYYSISLKRHVPESHMLRWIDRIAELAGFSEHQNLFTASWAAPPSAATMADIGRQPDGRFLQALQKS
ncbi:hypothetical protein [Sphingomonas sp. GC_Shp_3]|uniref:hypothetical protein n=1 Tax=Sphingomonas sp. GC_Shp_3 TaxID=2937383 RepID=UPI002269D353|nr:hypothetical protein [Sphingomonas sp. GC_Shp_3]